MYLSTHVLTVFLVHLIGWGVALTTLDYCLLSCDGVNHTMCDYLSGGGPGCEEFQGGLTDEEERLVVDLHNRLRQRIATGAESLEQPPAGNMMEVIWDREAAIIAQRWADQCDLLGHDRCRRTLHERHVGQNTAWMKGVDYPGRRRSRADVLEYFISGWFSEVERFPGGVDVFNPTDQELPRYAHYTQLVWGSTSELGCGFVQWVTDIEYEYKLVCNYVPGGNVRGAGVYRRGEACSMCPVFTRCSETYPGLCAAHDWSQIGDFKVSNSTEGETIKDTPAVEQVEKVEEEEEEAEEDEEEEEEHRVEETINTDSDTVSDASEGNTVDTDSRKGRGHALSSFIFVTIFTVLLNCYLSKLAVS